MKAHEVIEIIDKGRWTVDELLEIRDAINLAMRRVKRAEGRG